MVFGFGNRKSSGGTEEPPSSKTKVPPSSKTKVPPGSKTKVPPGSKSKVPPKSKMKVPPKSKTKEKPSSETDEIPSTKTKVPPKSKTKENPSSEPQEIPSTKTKVPPKSKTKVPLEPKTKELPNFKSRTTKSQALTRAPTAPKSKNTVKTKTTVNTKRKPLPKRERDVEKGPDKDEAAPKPKSTADEKSKEKDKGNEDDKLEYDPEDDVWTLEEGKASTGRKYARSVMNAFRPVLYLATMLGLFPLMAPRRAKDGTYSLKFAWLSFASIVFLFFATVVVGSTLWMLISLVCISINAPEHLASGGKSGEIYRSEEIFVYKRNAVNLVIIIASYIHLTICMVAVFHRKDYIAKQLIYWTEVVELLQLDVGRNVARRLLRQLLVIILCLTSFVVLYFLDVSPGLAGSGSTLYIVLTRVIDPNSLWHDNMKIRKLLFGVFLLYSVLAGYVYIIWFFYNCRILTNILRIWNNRFQYCLHKQILEFTNQQKSQDIRLGARAANRTSRAHLFQDHLVIFNLLEGVNAQFEVIMESFYLSTMLMIVFEAYGFVHACFYHEYTSCGSRQHDAIPILIMLGLQIYLYIIVTLEAAGVADEARHVLDIVRRKGMMTSRVDNELWFMMSMRLSFGGHEDVGIIGAGFFYITKAFLLGAISAITSHFIIFYQFEVPYAQTLEADANYVNLDVQALFKQLEGVPNTKC